MVTACSSLPVRVIDRPDMKVAADWDIKQQTIGYNTSLTTHLFLLKRPELDQSTSAIRRYLSCLFEC